MTRTLGLGNKLTTFPGTARYAVALVASVGLFMRPATGTAQAGVVSVDGTVISFNAKRGEVNDVGALTTYVDGASGELTDASAPIEAGAGCASQAGGVFCPFVDPFPKDVKLTVELLAGKR